MELSACGYLVTNYRQQKLIEKETVEFKYSSRFFCGNIFREHVAMYLIKFLSINSNQKSSFM